MRHVSRPGDVPASRDAHGIVEVPILVVIHSLLTLPFLRSNPVLSCGAKAVSMQSMLHKRAGHREV